VNLHLAVAPSLDSDLATLLSIMCPGSTPAQSHPWPA